MSSSKRQTLHAVNIEKTYRSSELSIPALRGISVEFHSSELVVLLGASGSGKSTLLNILGGLDTPSAGQVYFGDLELTACNEHELTHYRREHIGFVFQFYNLIPSLTALENVLLVTEIAREPMRAEEALELVDLQERLHHFPSQLSGGEQQRVAIARAIVKRPSIMLCDEPTGALDSRTGIRVLEAIEKVNREIGTTTILITHNAVISRIADRTVTMADGRITSDISNSKREAINSLVW